MAKLLSFIADRFSAFVATWFTLYKQCGCFQPWQQSWLSSQT